MYNDNVIPGEFHIVNSDIELNVNRKIIFIFVVNIGDRPIQVGSHFHFYEVNFALKFNRIISWGFRLNIPSGMSVRFEPKKYRIVELIQYSGNYDKIYEFD